MSVALQFPKLHQDTDTVVVHRTRSPEVTADAAAQWAERLGVKGKVEDAGARLIVRDRRSILEVFTASDSVRWASTPTGSEAPKRGRVPAGQDAIAIAERHLADLGLRDGEPRSTGVSINEVLRMDADAKEPTAFVAASQANFAYSLNGVRVVGPGAKAQVTIGPGGAVVAFYRFWRATEADHQVPLLPIDDAASILQRHEAWADLEEGSSSVEIHSVELVQYARPPREAQPYLIPAYAFTGTASSRELERYDFTMRVVAIPVDLDEAKRMGAVHRGADLVF